MALGSAGRCDEQSDRPSTREHSNLSSVALQADTEALTSGLMVERGARGKEDFTTKNM